MSIKRPQQEIDSQKKQQSLQDIELVLKKTFSDELVGIYLFGSWGSEFQTPESDIDLAILGSRKYAPADLWNTAQEIAAKLKRNIDLLDLRSVSTVMQMQVVSSGSRIYCADDASCEQFEDFVFSSYARLNEERREIIKDIQQRGSVYG